MEQALRLAERVSFSADYADNVLDRAVWALKSMDAAELQRIAAECEDVTPALPMPPVVAECAARLKRKLQLLDALLTHTRSTCELLQRLSSDVSYGMQNLPATYGSR